MAAGKYNIEMEQGATFTRDIIWKDSNGVAINITGYSIKMQAREDYDSVTPVISLGTVSPLTGITIIDAAAGRFRITITAILTAALTFTKAVYDLEMISGAGVVTRLLEGEITLLKEVTK